MKYTISMAFQLISILDKNNFIKIVMRLLYFTTQPLFFAMKKQLFFYFLFFYSFFGFAQNTFSLQGTVLSDQQLGLDAATVFLSRVQDSTVVDYTITNTKGYFDLKVKKQNQAVDLVISMIGFEDFKKRFDVVETSLDLGQIRLKAVATDLDELVIQAEVPPIRIKKDTLEFNASSFKVRPDSNVETLLKQLPGVEIDADKKITVNGKEVNQILVNGKPFFDADGQIALQNIPADLINKVQVTDTKTKKEEFTGKNSSSNNASINLTIDEAKNKGFFGKFMGGYGTDDRYESSGLLNYFKGKQKISLLGSSNNINASGFSMDEVFDNMGGGRSRRGAARGGRGSSSGLTRSNMFGLNFSDEYFDQLQASGSYLYNTSDTENTNRATRLNLLPSGEFTTRSNSFSKSYNENQQGNFSFEYEIDSTATLYVAPKLSKVYNYSRSHAMEASEDASGQLLNSSNSLSDSRNNSVNFNNSLRYSKKFKKRAHYFTASFTNSNSKQDGYALSDSETIFFTNSTASDLRKQAKDTYSTSDSYHLDLEYSQPITDSLALVFNVDYNWNQAIDAKKVFDFDGFTEDYTKLNVLETNTYKTEIRKLEPKVGISLVKSKFMLDLESGVQIVDHNSNALFDEALYSFSKKYLSPHLRGFARYTIAKGKSVYGNYNYNVQYPTGFQILDIEDVSNPLVTIRGNSNLKPSDTHVAFLSFNAYDFASRSGFNVYVNASFYNNQVVSSVVYDENKKQHTTYENISGAHSYSIGGNWSKSHKIQEHQLRYGVNMRLNHQKSLGFTDGLLYSSRGVQWSPGVYFNWDYGDYLTVMPSYNYTVYTTSYDNYVVDQATNFQHSFNFQVTSYWPENFVFGNDFGYSYNSRIAPGFKKSFYLWNTSLAYAFNNKNFIAKIKVYDVLNQNVSATRTISPTMILDQENTVLKRYIMFSLAYKFDRFGTGTSKQSRNKGGRIR